MFQTKTLTLWHSRNGENPPNQFCDGGGGGGEDGVEGGPRPGGGMSILDEEPELRCEDDDETRGLGEGLWDSGGRDVWDTLLGVMKREHRILTRVWMLQPGTELCNWGSIHLRRVYWSAFEIACQTISLLLLVIRLVDWTTLHRLLGPPSGPKRSPCKARGFVGARGHTVVPPTRALPSSNAIPHTRPYRHNDNNNCDPCPCRVLVRRTIQVQITIRIGLVVAAQLGGTHIPRQTQ
ncbi:hypothetical protein AG1IA_08036 [Rhizoctonia solani AG-1 IA]|uniref:Uncharacterized protein n=1 Tax=Thanatephorus cucumeris (strain AG1-IA) TaxID=983506 RepID=L8WMD4_THACA|nr:hypothetical protein AG1IA_08036 [Rhizoctonia solani AG-1 IA]